LTQQRREGVMSNVWVTVCIFISLACPSIAQCDYGYFGINCTSSCHCLNNDFCNQTDGRCSNWKCDRGYTGLPQCQEICPDMTFGLDCAFECHCPVNDNCSNVNGDCSSGRCHPDWGSAGCQK
ncbi:unnamed protein product, partial [Candidula unifasciata]